MTRSMLVILIGKSGCGKDTLMDKLVHEEKFYSIVTTTTRPMREGETDGVNYNFISRDEFEKKIKNDEFLEYRSYNTLVDGKPDTWYYGSPKRELLSGVNYVTILDVQGAKEYQNFYGKKNCFVAMIEVSDSVREERARERGSFDQTEWERRVKDDNDKFSLNNIAGVVNAKISNSGDLDWTVSALLHCMKATEKNAQRQHACER